MIVPPIPWSSVGVCGGVSIGDTARGSCLMLASVNSDEKSGEDRACSSSMLISLHDDNDDDAADDVEDGTDFTDIFSTALEAEAATPGWTLQGPEGRGSATC